VMVDNGYRSRLVVILISYVPKYEVALMIIIFTCSWSFVSFWLLIEGACSYLWRRINFGLTALNLSLVFSPLK